MLLISSEIKSSDGCTPWESSISRSRYELADDEDASSSSVLAIEQRGLGGTLALADIDN